MFIARNHTLNLSTNLDSEDLGIFIHYEPQYRRGKCSVENLEAKRCWEKKGGSDRAEANLGISFPITCDATRRQINNFRSSITSSTKLSFHTSQLSQTSRRAGISTWHLQLPWRFLVAVCSPNNPSMNRQVLKSMIVPKKPIKKLPTSVEVTDKTTVQDVKENLAKRAGGWDPNRFGLYEPEKKKLLKDRRALISQQQSIISGKEILVKDLGMFLRIPLLPNLRIHRS